MLHWIKTVTKQMLRHRKTPDLIRRVGSEGLSYLEADALCDLYDSVRAVEKCGIPGILVEAGCALGGSAIVMASAKSRERPLKVFDVFGLIPAPSEHDGPDVHARFAVIAGGKATGLGGKTYYGYEPNLRDKVIDNFRRFGIPIEQNAVQLVEGLFQDSLDIDLPVAVAHIDGDWYESVRTCLVRIVPHLSPGGRLIIDDYSAWSGCRKAVDEFFQDKKKGFRFVHESRLHIIRRQKAPSNRKAGSLIGKC